MSKIKEKNKKEDSVNETDSAVEDIKSVSLVSPSGMGGLIGGGGYNFQSRYIACHIPEWLADPAFTQILAEGTGDVDVRFGNSKNPRREHIQVKDHEVKNKSEIKDIVEVFHSFDKGMPGVYEKFVLACPAVGGQVKQLKSWLERLRGARSFFLDDAEIALATTISDIKSLIQELGLSEHEELIFEKLYFQSGLMNFHEDGTACDTFVMHLITKHPEHRRRIVEGVKPAYKALFNEIVNNQGKTLERTDLKSLIDSAIEDDPESNETAINLDIHNWTFEKYERQADYVINWSEKFDRDFRKVPSDAEWNNELIPELYATRKRIASEVSTRLIKLRGKNCLTTGVALGAAFPEIGGWRFEIPQPTEANLWHSGAVPELSYKLTVDEEIQIDPDGNSIAFLFNIKGNALRDVETFIKEKSIPVKAILPVGPPGTPSGKSIANDREAVSLALSARDELHKALIRHDVRDTHLFFYGPFALSVFVGQLLTSIGRIHLYEFQDPGYIPSATLRT